LIKKGQIFINIKEFSINYTTHLLVKFWKL